MRTAQLVGTGDMVLFIPDVSETPVRVTRPLRLVSVGTVQIDAPQPAPPDASSHRFEGQRFSPPVAAFFNVLFGARPGGVEAGDIAALTSALQRASDAQAGLELALAKKLGKIGDALFVATTEEGSLEAFVVVREHTDDVYDAVVLAEEELFVTLGNRAPEVHVRAHQGVDVERVVPAGARRIHRGEGHGPDPR